MKTTEINAILALRKLELSEVAKKIEENRSFLAQVVGYHPQRNPDSRAVRRARLKFAFYLGMRVEEVFDDADPATKAEIDETRKQLAHLDWVVVAA